MRVLLIHNYYQHFGGEDCAAESDRRLLMERGVEVCMYSRHNNEILHYGLARKALFPIKTMWSSRTVSDLESVLTGFPADVAYLHNLYPLISPSVYQILHQRGIPIVQVLHDFRPFCANGWLYTNGNICDLCTGGRHWNAVIHKCMHQSRAVSAIYAATLWRLEHSGALDHVSAFICPSEFCRLQALKNGIEDSKIFVRAHSIDLPVRVGPEPIPLRPSFLYLGRLSREKGLWTLIQAFEPLTRIPLSIAGSGPIEPEIRRYLEEHRLSHIKLVGFQAGAAKDALLQNARAVIVPSESHETFGITVLESYAAARPVIASDAGALQYLVKDGVTGLVFERKNTEALRNHVMALADNHAGASRMGLEAQRHVARHYGLDAAYQKLMSIFEAAMTRQAAFRLPLSEQRQEKNASPGV